MDTGKAASCHAPTYLLTLAVTRLEPGALLARDLADGALGCERALEDGDVPRGLDGVGEGADDVLSRLEAYAHNSKHTASAWRVHGVRTVGIQFVLQGWRGANPL